MSDNITLPREVVEGALEALDSEHPDIQLRAAIALRKAFAAEPQKPSDDRKAMKEALRILTKPESGDLRWQVSDACDILRTAIRTAPPALAAEQPKQEPVATVGTQSNAAWKGYDGRWTPPGDPIKVVHLLRDLPLGTLLYTAPPEDEALRRDAERYRWLRDRAWFQFEFEGRYGDSGETVQELDAAIDAAMENKR